VLVVDVHALTCVHVLDLTHDIAEDRLGPAKQQQVVRVHRTFCQLCPGLDGNAVGDARAQTCAARDRVDLLLAVLSCDRERPCLVALLDGERTGDLSELRLPFRLTRLEKLGDTRQTVCDVLTGDTAV